MPKLCKSDSFSDDFVPAVDPHIRVGGTSEECVRRAKAYIMDYLDTKTSRVTMKMDVSYTDHSHVIGKGGKNEGRHVKFRVNVKLMKLQFLNLQPR